VGIDPIVTASAKLDLGDYLPYLTNRVGTIIAEQFGADALAEHGLSIAMWRVMAVLASHGSQRQIDLADLTSIEVSTLSRLVTRLTRNGLVTRTRSVNSSREVAVKLSSKGHSLVSHLIPIALDYEAAAIAGLSAKEIAVLKRCLRRMYGNMKNRAAAPAKRPASGAPAASRSLPRQREQR
jgi:MarR family transcriptional regulator, organic hydroperoxide resistance regulator